jgi:hypothetical protein
LSPILAPTLVDIERAFSHGFSGMTREPFALKGLIATRISLIDAIVGDLPQDHRTFLVSFARGDADWKLFGLPKAAELPAVRWRQENLNKLTREKRTVLVERLETVLAKSNRN